MSGYSLGPRLGWLLGTLRHLIFFFLNQRNNLHFDVLGFMYSIVAAILKFNLFRIKTVRILDRIEIFRVKKLLYLLVSA
jgi:hypothetical protein